VTTSRVAEYRYLHIVDVPCIV